MAAYNYIDATGIIVADTSTIKTEVETEYKGVFGQDFVIDDQTPEGVLANSEVLARRGLMENNATLANQINPNLAEGVFLDAIWALTSAITGIRRSAERSTINNVDITGVAGTVIPAGTILLTSTDEWETVDEVTLGPGGTATVDCQSVEFGPIGANIGELNAIKTGAPLGLETVNNTTSATLGRLEETDQASRLRRVDTLSLQNVSMNESITSALYNVDGVKSLSYRENYTSSDTVIDGIFLLAHSIYACVDGGIDQDVAQALLHNKSGGANYNGAIQVDVTDQDSGQIYPIKFDRPAEIQVWVRVTIKPTSITDPWSVIDKAVLDFANGLIEGERGFVVGGDVSPFEIGAAINKSLASLFVSLVEISTDGLNYNSTVLSIELDEVARTSASQINTVIS